MHVQRWTFKKIVCYSIYRLIAKHIPNSIPFLGQKGHLLRRIVCRPLFLESAKIVGIGQGVDFDNGCFIRMREYANIGDHAILSGNHGTITIGRHVMMGKQCIVLCQNHKYLTTEYDGYEGKDNLIDDHAWIGHRVIILPGVKIGKYAIVGAGSVVVKNIPDYAIAAGNPAIVKKYRKDVEKWS